MSKRKIDEVDGAEDQIPDRALRIKVSRLKAKVDQGNQILSSALKLAKGFERQKLGRRQKAAEEEPHTLLRLREEVIILKQLNCVETAKRYLFKQLAKTTRIRKSAAFVKKYGTQPNVEAPNSTAEANVLGRLFKSAPVTKVMPSIMESVYQVLNIDQDQPQNNDKPAKQPADSPPSIDRHLPHDAQDAFLGFSDDDTVNLRNPNHLDAATDGDLGSTDGMVVGGSDESEVGSALDEDGTDDDIQDGREDRDSSPYSDTMYAQGDNSKSGSLDPTKRALIPSLTVGGYYSGSESEDDGADVDGGQAPTSQRNNRRGQRARQKIAEMKYGKNAKHLQKQPQGQQAQWDAKRGAVDARGTKRGHFDKAVSRGHVNGDGRRDETGSDRTQSKASQRKTHDERPLHPSWEAAKKRKESTAASIAFAGKKVTFD